MDAWLGEAHDAPTMVPRASRVVVAVALLASSCALLLAACAPEPRPTASGAVIATLPIAGLSPVSISDPSQGAKDAFAKCHIGDQFSIERVAGMGQIPSARDLFHYVPLTGREREFNADVPAWVIQFHGDIPMRDGLWTDPVCIVTPESFGYYATGPSKDYNTGMVSMPEPPPTPPDRSLPPLLP
jgi:hypothetical protein